MAFSPLKMGDTSGYFFTPLPITEAHGEWALILGQLPSQASPQIKRNHPA